MTKNKIKIDTIFVDCFNTVLGRTKIPEDVLLDWGEAMNEHYSQISAFDFFRMFKACWKNLTKIATLEIEKSDFVITTFDIFSEMANIISQYNLINNFAKTEFVTFAQDTYFNAEHLSHYAKTRTIKYLKKQKARGKKIYMVSDFYCDKTVLKNWLLGVQIQVDELFDDIFVSCDLKKSKTTGSIYKELLNRLNLNPKQVKMVGDNVYADRFPARKIGLRTKSVFPHIKFPSWKLIKVRQKIEIPQEYQEVFNEDLKNGSYSNYAFPFYLFTKKLAQQCERKQIKNLFFLARDGEFLKKMFDEYCNYHNIKITTHYFVVSRLSTLNASILPYEQAFNGLSNKPFISPKNFMKTLGFSQEEIETIGKEAKINVKTFYPNLSKTKAYKKILESPTFKILYDERRERQHIAFNNYAKSFNVDLKKEGFIFVDSGWLGNMSKHIKNAFAGENVHVESYYVGCVNPNSVQNKLYGLLFSERNKHTWENKVLSFRRLNYEELLRTNQNSCCGYSPETNLPILAQGDKEKITFDKYIKPMQDKIFKKFQKIMDIDNRVYCPLESVVAKIAYKIISKSNKHDKKFFDKIQETYCDNFGYIGFSYVHFSSWLRRTNFWIKDKTFLIKNFIRVRRKRLFLN